MELTRWERRLAGQWADAFIPAFDGMESARAALDAAFWRRYQQTAPPLLQLGFRAAVLIASAARLGRSREDCLRRWSSSPRYLARQLTLVLRIVFSLAHFSRAEVRERVT